MKIGLIDVDGHHYPNLPLMKLSLGMVRGVLDMAAAMKEVVNA